MIINLDKYREKSGPSIYMGGIVLSEIAHTPTDIELYICQQERFSIDINNMKYKTRSHKFMFPTILHRYKKNINPVSALYNTTQAVLIYYDENNPTHEWVLGLFTDTKWLDDLVIALNSDIAMMRSIIKKYRHFKSPYIEKKLKELSTSADRFEHYINTFHSIEEWRVDNT